MTRGTADAEAILLGGGVAGAAAAIALARAGRRVVLVEREAGPREKVCGEFLGADAAACLARLGLDLAALGAVPVGRARLARGRRVAEIPLPFAAWGLPRRVLDEALLAAAETAGATLLRGRAARGAARDPATGLWTVRLSGGLALRAPRLVLATGKHELRGLAREARERRAIGLKLHLRPAVPPEGVTLLVFPGGYAGLQPTAGGLANLCVALRRDDAAAEDGIARDAAALLARVAAGSDLAAAMLAGARPVQARPIAVARIPYGFLHRDRGAAAPEGLWRVGDQFAVIPSFSGDGVAMALAGGLAAAEAIAAGRSAAAFHAAWRRRVAPGMRLAALAGTLLDRAPSVLLALTAGAPGLARRVAARTRLA